MCRFLQRSSGVLKGTRGCVSLAGTGGTEPFLGVGMRKGGENQGVLMDPWQGVQVVVVGRGSLPEGFAVMQGETSVQENNNGGGSGSREIH